MATKQLPLFPSQPTSPDEISKQTPLGATLELFRKFLSHEGKSQHTVKAFMGDMNLLCEYTDETTAIGKYTTTILKSFKIYCLLGTSMVIYIPISLTKILIQWPFTRF